MKVGNRVRRADSEQSDVTAYRNMRGSIVETHPTRGDLVRVHWDCDDTPEPNWRRVDTVRTEAHT